VSRFVPSPRRLLAAVGALVVLAAVAATVTFGLRYENLRAQEQSRVSALEAAERYVVTMFGFNPENIEENIRKTMAVVTGDAKKEFEDRVLGGDDVNGTALATAVKEQGVVSQVEIQAAGVVENTRDTAKVLLFINQSASAASLEEVSANPSRVIYAMKRESGTWKITDIELVTDETLQHLLDPDAEQADAIPIPNPTEQTPAPEGDQPQGEQPQGEQPQPGEVPVG